MIVISIGMCYVASIDKEVLLSDQHVEIEVCV